MALNVAGPGTRPPRLLAVSHPAVLPVNQLVYAALAARGWAVQVVVPARWRHEYAGEDFAPVPLPELKGALTALPVAQPGRPQRHLHLANPRRVLRWAAPDVVFVEQEPFALAALQWGLAAHSLGLPFGVQIDENLDRPLPLPVRAWRSWVLRHAAFVAARSETAARLARGWGATGPVELIPHHVPGWKPRPRPPGDPFRVGFAGRLVPEKGIDVLVDAVRRLRGPVELVVAGDGPQRAWLESQDLGEARLRIVRGQAHLQMDEVYAQMDVLVLPSRSTAGWAEQFGRALVEALACGVPVLGSDSGEIPWVIGLTGGGCVFPEDDAEALAALLDTMRRDDSERRRLAIHGRERAISLFGVDSVAGRLESALHAAAGPPADLRPSVALVAHGIHDRGGMERACAELIRRTHQDFRFIAVTAELAPDLVPFVARTIRVRVPPRPIPLKFLSFFIAGGVAVRRARADLVHTVGAVVPNRAGVAVVQYCHAGARRAVGAFAPPGAPAVRKANTSIARALAMLAERWCYRPSGTRILVPVSEGIAGELRAHYPGNRVVVVPNGVDLTRFAPDTHDRAATRAALHAAATDLVALFVGGDWDRKGLAIAIEAVAKARAEGVSACLWVVGAGDRERFAALADGLGLQHHARFLGARADTERFYRAADVFVYPSAYEAFSLAMLEAAASGLPLVVTAVNGTQELVGASEAGLVVEATAGAVAGALVALGSDRDRAKTMGSRARARAEAFSWDRTASGIADLYGQLLVGRP